MGLRKGSAGFHSLHSRTTNPSCSGLAKSHQQGYLIVLLNNTTVPAHIASKFFQQGVNIYKWQSFICKTPDVTIILPLSSLSLPLFSFGCSDICSVAQVDTQLPSQELAYRYRSPQLARLLFSLTTTTNNHRQNRDFIPTLLFQSIAREQLPI